MKRPRQYFRAGVGAAIINDRGLVLALERSDIRGAWQLPQGGMKASEDPREAVIREVAEETGIRESDLQLLDEFPAPLVYELPVDVRTKKTGRGQVQHWFLFRFKGTDTVIDVKGGGEFRSWKWVPFEYLFGVVVGFRRPVDQQLALRFGQHFFQSNVTTVAPAAPSQPSEPVDSGM